MYLNLCIVTIRSDKIFVLTVQLYILSNILHRFGIQAKTFIKVYMVSEPGPIAVAHRHPFVARVGLDVLLPHVRGRVGSPTSLGY
jgi:hypothetical protein